MAHVWSNLIVVSALICTGPFYVIYMHVHIDLHIYKHICIYAHIYAYTCHQDMKRMSIPLVSHVHVKDHWSRLIVENKRLRSKENKYCLFDWLNVSLIFGSQK